MAKTSGFTLIGDLFADQLVLECSKDSRHKTAIPYHKRLQAVIKCADCRKDEARAEKERQIEEENIRDSYFRQMQE